MNLDDPFARGIAQITMVIIVAVIIAPGLFACALALDYSPTNGTSPSLEAIHERIPSPATEDTKAFLNVLSALIAAIPALLVAVAFRHSPAHNETRLNWFGYLLAFIFLFGAILSSLGYWLLDPVQMGPNSLGVAPLTSLRVWALRSIEACVVYGAILLGVRKTITRRE